MFDCWMIRTNYERCENGCLAIEVRFYIVAYFLEYFNAENAWMLSDARKLRTFQVLAILCLLHEIQTRFHQK
jgi:hypothetical protein